MGLRGLGDVLRLYRARMRAGSIRAQEGFAVLGIAVGVALLFASQIASASLSHSVGELTREVVGRTQWELAARGSDGVSEALLGEVERIPGVRIALPLVEAPGVASSARGSRSIVLIGTNPRQAQLVGTLFGRLSDEQLSHADAVALPATLAGELGVEALEPVKLELGGRTLPTLVGATLGQHEIGGLVGSPLVFAPLSFAQRLTHMQGHLSRVFVAALPGQGAAVHAGLTRLAARYHLNLEPADWEATLFATASSPQDQSETLFSLLSAFVGLLLAMNAILITVPARRRLIEDIRLAGATRAKTIQIMLVDAAVIGVLACILGLVLGDVLSRTLFGVSPGYLSFAFPVGSARIITPQALIASIATGMVAAVVGVLWPVRDILATHEQASEHAPRRLLGWRLGAGGACIALALVILLVRPASASLGVAALLLALIFLLVPLFELAVYVFDLLQRRLGGAASRLAVLELGNPVTRVRSLAIVATAAIAVFGTIALAGAQSNLEGGLDRSARDIDSSAQIWVAPGGESNAFATTPIRGTATSAALARIPGVASVGSYGGSFLNWGRRRLWVLAPPRNATQQVPSNQLIGGGVRQAAAAVRGSEGVLLSQALAEEHHLHVGDYFTLPSPQPIRMRLVGLITNLGWPPGAIVMSAPSYARAWGSREPSALFVDAKPGVRSTQLAERIRHALKGASGLRVETATQREHRHEALAHQGLARLTQIRVLMAIAAVLAIAGALSALLWQRRDLIAGLRVIGFRRGVLWRSLCEESAVLIATGCILGAVWGVLGQLMLSHALRSVTGFPIIFNLDAAALVDCVLIGAAAAVAAAAIGYPVASVPPNASPAY